MSRRKIPVETALTHGIKTRVTASAFQTLIDQLNRSHYRTMAEMLREMVCNGQIKLVTVDKTMSEVMERLIPIRRELGAIGNNLNQIARTLNTPGVRVLPVMEMTAQMTELRGQLEGLQAMISELSRRWLSGNTDSETEP